MEPEELIERDLNLIVQLPGGQERPVTVHGSKPVMDLLVTLCAQFHLNPADHIIELVSTNQNQIKFKPNSLIGALEAEKVVLKPKGNEEIIRRVPSMPVATVRLMINYKKSHKAVVRVSPRVPLAELMPAVCEKCELNLDTTVLLRDRQSEEPLDLSKTLNDYGIRDLYAKDTKVVSNVPSDPVTPTHKDCQEGKWIIREKRQREKENRGFLSLFRRSKKTAQEGVSNISSAPTSPVLKNHHVVNISCLKANSPTLKPSADMPKKRRAPQPPSMMSSQSFSCGLNTSQSITLPVDHTGEKQGVLSRVSSTESCLKRTKRRAPPPPCTSPPIPDCSDGGASLNLTSLEEAHEEEEEDVPSHCSDDQYSDFTVCSPIQSPSLMSEILSEFMDVVKAEEQGELQSNGFIRHSPPAVNNCPNSESDHDSSTSILDSGPTVASGGQLWRSCSQRDGLTTFTVVPRRRQQSLKQYEVLLTLETSDSLEQEGEEIGGLEHVSNGREWRKNEVKNLETLDVQDLERRKKEVENLETKDVENLEKRKKEVKWRKNEVKNLETKDVENLKWRKNEEKNLETKDDQDLKRRKKEVKNLETKDVENLEKRKKEVKWRKNEVKNLETKDVENLKWRKNEEKNLETKDDQDLKRRKKEVKNLETKDVENLEWKKNEVKNFETKDVHDLDWRKKEVEHLETKDGDNLEWRKKEVENLKTKDVENLEWRKNEVKNFETKDVHDLDWRKKEVEHLETNDFENLEWKKSEVENLETTDNLELCENETTLETRDDESLGPSKETLDKLKLETDMEDQASVEEKEEEKDWVEEYQERRCRFEGGNNRKTLKFEKWMKDFEDGLNYTVMEDQMDEVEDGFPPPQQSVYWEEKAREKDFQEERDGNSNAFSLYPKSSSYDHHHKSLPNTAYWHVNHTSSLHSLSLISEVPLGYQPPESQSNSEPYYQESSVLTPPSTPLSTPDPLSSHSDLEAPSHPKPNPTSDPPSPAPVSLFALAVSQRAQSLRTRVYPLTPSTPSSSSPTSISQQSGVWSSTPTYTAEKSLRE